MILLHGQVMSPLFLTFSLLILFKQPFSARLKWYTQQERYMEGLLILTQRQKIIIYILTFFSLYQPEVKVNGAGLTPGQRPGSSGRLVEPPRQRPRTLLLQKKSQDFGFTLRHFIVYPPGSEVLSSTVSQCSVVVVWMVVVVLVVVCEWKDGKNW